MPDKKPIENLKPVEPAAEKPKSQYFDNAKVEELLTKYVQTGCTDVDLRDDIMSHAGELIRQIIRTHNLHNIYPGKDQSSFGDLFQVAWVQIEKTLYKFDYSPGHTKVFNMWCVHPDTLIFTSDGIMPIKEVVHRKHDDQISTLGISGETAVTAGIQKYEKNTSKIELEMGYDIECTPEHKLRVLASDGPEWRMAGDLKIGDLIGIQYRQEYFINRDDLTEIKAPVSRGEWNPPAKLNEELAYILGLYLAGGSHSYGKLVIYNIDGEVVNALVNNKLGLNFIHEPQYQRVSLCNKRFIEFVTNFGFGKERANTKKIPARILTSSRSIQVAFLRGMYDGDGHSSRHNGVVGYTSSSKILIDQLKMVLLNLGILTKLSTDNRKTSTFKKNKKTYTSEKKTSYQLTCSTAHSDKFYQIIGFAIDRKQAKRKALVSNRQYIYGLNDKFRILNEKYGPGKYGYNRVRTALTHDTATLSIATKVVASWESVPEAHEYRFIRERINEATAQQGPLTVWVPITKITDSKAEVCEISVEAEDHSYIANGIISHNSQVARTVMLAHIKREGRDRKNQGAYTTHLNTKFSNRSPALERFFTEAKEICKYNMEHLEIIRHLEELYDTDDKASEGLIGKLIKRSGKSRQKVHAFLDFIRMRNIEFSDSPSASNNFKPYLTGTVRDDGEDED